MQFNSIHISHCTGVGLFNILVFTDSFISICVYQAGMAVLVGMPI